MGIGGMWAAATFRVLSLSLPVPDLDPSWVEMLSSDLRERETFEQEEEDLGRGGAVEGG